MNRAGPCRQHGMGCTFAVALHENLGEFFFDAVKAAINDYLSGAGGEEYNALLDFLILMENDEATKPKPKPKPKPSNKSNKCWKCSKPLSISGLHWNTKSLYWNTTMFFYCKINDLHFYLVFFYNKIKDLRF